MRSAAAPHQNNVDNRPDVIPAGGGSSVRLAPAVDLPAGLLLGLVPVGVLAAPSTSWLEVSYGELEREWELTPYDEGEGDETRLAGAYATIANYGVQTRPYGILSVRDGNNEMLYKHESVEFPIVLQADATKRLIAMMQEVVYREHQYQVQRPVWQTSYREECYTVARPVSSRATRNSSGPISAAACCRF